ncbi:hypothetical protein AAL_07307 [Moelleriella libera RCEF 2490]|uniref:Uncharacterized protein n=1 Tax=Moelleriella libera RCEF 2490 TaxID=1081109 RepID=A0A167XKT7_9HYPO|nr:hypothetical protein AAL_07307 [Moelleriella libera RCEF 2490]
MRENNKHIVTDRSKNFGDTPGKNAVFTRDYEKPTPDQKRNKINKEKRDALTAGLPLVGNGKKGYIHFETSFPQVIIDQIAGDDQFIRDFIEIWSSRIWQPTHS